MDENVKRPTREWLQTARRIIVNPMITPLFAEIDYLTEKIKQQETDMACMRMALELAAQGAPTAPEMLEAALATDGGTELTERLKEQERKIRELQDTVLRLRGTLYDLGWQPNDVRVEP